MPPSVADRHQVPGVTVCIDADGAGQPLIPLLVVGQSIAIGVYETGVRQNQMFKLIIETVTIGVDSFRVTRDRSDRKQVRNSAYACHPGFVYLYRPAGHFGTIFEAVSISINPGRRQRDVGACVVGRPIIVDCRIALAADKQYSDGEQTCQSAGLPQ